MGLLGTVGDGAPGSKDYREGDDAGGEVGIGAGVVVDFAQALLYWRLHITDAFDGTYQVRGNVQYDCSQNHQQRQETEVTYFAEGVSQYGKHRAMPCKLGKRSRTSLAERPAN